MLLNYLDISVRLYISKEYISKIHQVSKIKELVYLESLRAFPTLTFSVFIILSWGTIALGP